MLQNRFERECYNYKTFPHLVFKHLFRFFLNPFVTGDVMSCHRNISLPPDEVLSHHDLFL